MSKEYLEALERMCSTTLEEDLSVRDIYETEYGIVEQALNRLEAIEKGKNTDIIDNYMAFKNDNAEPSEALECLEKLKGMEISSMPFSDEYGTQEVDLNDIRKVGSQLNTDFREYTTTIKQALLKAQTQELNNGGRLPNKEILYLKQSLEQCNDKPIFYVSRTYGNKYIVTQKFLDDLTKENARNEEILQKYYQEGITLDSVRALKQENAELRKKAQKEHKALDLLMQELDCKDFADLRKYARCGYEKLNSFKVSKEVKIEIPESSLMDYNPTKQYLKWEDLDFNHTPKMIDVKMSGNKYKLVVGYNVAGENLSILRDGKQKYYFLECDKQFFNDLHLERVE